MAAPKIPPFHPAEMNLLFRRMGLYNRTLSYAVRTGLRMQADPQFSAAIAYQQANPVQPS